MEKDGGKHVLARRKVKNGRMDGVESEGDGNGEWRRWSDEAPDERESRSRRWHTPGRYCLCADLGKCASKAGGTGERGARSVWQAGGWDSHRVIHAEEFAWSSGESHYVWDDADGIVGAGPYRKRSGRSAGV